MSYTPRERFLTALAGKEPDRVPFGELNIDETVAYKILGCPKNEYHEGHLEKTRVPLEDQKELSRILGRDVISFALRAPIFVNKESGKDGRLFYREGLIRTIEDIDRYDLPDPQKDTLFEEAHRFIEGKEEFAVVAATRMGIFPTILSLGYEKFCTLMYDNPDLVECLMDKYVDWQMVVVEKLSQMGVDAILSTDDMAWKGGLMFSPVFFRSVVLPRMKKVAEKITVPWILHSDGDITEIVEDLLDMGIAGLHPIEPVIMDMAVMKKRYGNRVCLLGNINLTTLTLGTPADVEEEVRSRIREAGPGGGYILTSANSIASFCKPENVLAMAEAVRKYGTYPIG